MVHGCRGLTQHATHEEFAAQVPSRACSHQSSIIPVPASSQGGIRGGHGPSSLPAAWSRKQAGSHANGRAPKAGGTAHEAEGQRDRGMATELRCRRRCHRRQRLSPPPLPQRLAATPTPQQASFVSEEEQQRFLPEQLEFLERKRRAAAGLGPIMPEACTCQSCFGSGSLACHQCNGTGVNAGQGRQSCSRTSAAL